LGFKEKDLHITLGFRHKDVHGVRKNEIIKEKERFHVTLKQYYYDFDCSFNFCRHLDNFSFSLTDEIYCTKIEKTYAEFKVGKGDMVDRFTISLGIKNFIIGCKWREFNDKSKCLDTNKIKEIL
jgi:hypothetical protein